MKYFKLYRILALSWTIVTIGLSSIPSSSIPRTLLNEIFGIDKVAHIIFYFTMMSCWSLYIRYFFNISKALAISALLSLSIGVMMEVYQGVYFPERSFDWFDSLANGIGVFFGYFFIRKFEKLFPIFAKS